MPPNTPNTPGGVPPLAMVPSGAAVGYEAGKIVGANIGQPRVTALPHPVPYTVLPDGMGGFKVEWLHQEFSHPTTRRGTVKLDDAASFIAYFKEHARPESRIYAKLDPAEFIAVLDEHPGYVTPPPAAAPGAVVEAPMSKSTGKVTALPPPAEPFQQPAPAWREFRAEFSPALSREWQLWTGKHKQRFEGTEAFALFVEDNLPDITQPDGATLLQIALNFRVHQDVTFKSAARLQDGNIDLQYQNVIDAESPSGSSTYSQVKIPERFTISIPVFAGINSPVFDIEARFRFRLEQGQLRIWYELVRYHKVLEAAFKGVWEAIAESTGRTVLLGSPE